MFILKKIKESRTEWALSLVLAGMLIFFFGLAGNILLALNKGNIENNNEMNHRQLRMLEVLVRERCPSER